MANTAMIVSTAFSSLISLAIQGSERLPEIARTLAPVVQDAMESLRHDDEVLLNWSTVLVGFGVFLEFFEIRHELREKTGPFRFHHPEMPKWVVWAGFIGWLMIVVGVSGEFVFEGAVNTWSEELEGISDALLRDAQLATAEATRQAGSAAQSAGRAQKASDAVGRQANALEKQETGIALRLRGDESSEAALRNALLPRSVDAAKLRSTLFPFILWPVRIDTIDDAEALHTANLIASALVKAQWPGTGVVTDVGVDFPDGIQVKEHCVWSLTNKQIMEGCTIAGERLTRALSNAGLPDVSFTGTNQKLPDNSFNIIIGLRKIPGETVPNVSRKNQ